jgi:hypothetical protein
MQQYLLRAATALHRLLPDELIDGDMVATGIGSYAKHHPTVMEGKQVGAYG